MKNPKRDDIKYALNKVRTLGHIVNELKFSSRTVDDIQDKRIEALEADVRDINMCIDDIYRHLGFFRPVNK